MNSDFGQVDWNRQLEDDFRQLVRLAVREDLDRFYDWTTVSLVPAGARAAARLVARESGIISGVAGVQLAIDEMEADIEFQPNKLDGDGVDSGDEIGVLRGSARDLLTTERILLNFLGRLSGIATLTGRYVALISHTAAKIYDTRKTTPGWRRLEKFAVRAGGGCNHRVGLFEAVMIKDNHLAMSQDAGLTPSAAVLKTKRFLNNAATENERLATMVVEVEVDTVQQFRDVVVAKPDIVLLDNMSLDGLGECVAFRNERAPDIVLEASGGVNLDTVSDIAETQVDRISVGALTHSAVNFDVGLDWE